MEQLTGLGGSTLRAQQASENLMQMADIASMGIGYQVIAQIIEGGDFCCTGNLQVMDMYASPSSED